MVLDSRAYGKPIQAPVMGHLLPVPTPLPFHLAPSPVMITSLPGVSTQVDNVTRQFYRSGRVPQRRMISPL